MKINELLSYGYQALKKAEVETYILDSQLLLAKVLEKNKLFIITNRDEEVGADKVSEYKRAIDLRKNKMPVKYILQNCEFMGLDFFIKEGVLIPRPDTEVLVEETLKIIEHNNYKTVADVCCGSGIIGISIAHYAKNTTVSSYDISDIAIEVTVENIKRLKLTERVNTFKSDLLKSALEKHEKFDIIVSNPPYIKKDVIPTLMEDVKDYEPFIALCGGEDGLDFYRRIIEEARLLLKSGGTIAFEIGYDQGEEVSKLLEKSSFTDIDCIADLADNDRVVIGRFLG